MSNVVKLTSKAERSALTAKAYEQRLGMKFAMHSSLAECIREMRSFGATTKDIVETLHFAVGRLKQEEPR